MDKAESISILKKVLGADDDLDFLHKLEETELIKLVKLIREKIGLSKGLH